MIRLIWCRGRGSVALSAAPRWGFGPDVCDITAEDIGCVVDHALWV
jgi:hypothetical protein